MPLIDANTCAQLEAHGLKVFPQVNLGCIAPQDIAVPAHVGGGKNYTYALKYKAPVIIWSGCTLNSCIMGAYSYVNSSSCLNLCEVGNYCSLASELKLGLPRHLPTRVSTSSCFYTDIPFLNQWRGTPLSGFTAGQCPITIGHDVWIGNNVIIPAPRPITIGTGAVIAAGAVVTHDVPPYAVVGGSPARVLKLRFPEEVCADLMYSRWFEYDLPRSPHCAQLHLDDPKLFLEHFFHYRKDIARLPDGYLELKV